MPAVVVAGDHDVPQIWSGLCLTGPVSAVVIGGSLLV
jgi:hypothetical protein